MKKLLLLITFLSSFFVRGQMTKDDLIGKTFVADVTQYTPEINGEPFYKHSDEQHPQVNLYLIFEKKQVIVKEEDRVTKQVFRKDTRSWTLKGGITSGFHKQRRIATMWSISLSFIFKRASL